MTSADLPSRMGQVRVLVSEPVPQELDVNVDGGRQGVETRDSLLTPRKVTDVSPALGESVAGNARRSRRLPFAPLMCHLRPPTTPADD